MKANHPILLKWVRVFGVSFSILLGIKLHALTAIHTTLSDFQTGSQDGNSTLTSVSGGEVALVKKATSLGAWTTTTPFPEGFTEINLFANSTYVYVAGYDNSSGNPSTNIYSAPHSAAGIGPWTLLGTMTTPLMYSGVAVWRDRVYLVGGGYTGCCSYLTTTAVISAQMLPGGGLSAFTTVGNILSPRSSVIATIQNGKLLCLHPDSSVSFDIYTDGGLGPAVSITAPPAMTGVGFQAQALDHYWVSGGDNNGGTLNNKVYTAAVQADGSLGAFTLVAGTLPASVTWFGNHDTNANGLYVMAGGRTGFSGPWASQPVYAAVLNSDGTVGSWTAQPSLPAARGLGQTVLLDGFVCYFGGFDTSLTQQSTIYRAPLTLSGSTVDSSIYANGFDLGQISTINSVTSTITGSGSVDLQVRLASTTGAYSSWESAASVAGQTARYIEYKAKLVGGGSDLSLDQVKVDYDLGTPTPTPTVTITTSPTPSITATPATATTTLTPLPYKAADAGTNFVFPSPVLDGHATLAYLMVLPGSMKMDIWNEKGELAASVEDDKGAGPQFTPFSVSGFAAGVYFYRVTLTYSNGSKEVAGIKKFAVQR